jgi:NTP pyrophosphatase (non-canonical NTP hydrolase)
MASEQFSLDDLYHMVANIYSEQNVQRPVSATFAHFVEVCGMLTMHSRKKKREELNFENALCKALGWLFPLLAKCKVNSLEALVFRKFPYACPYCRLAPHLDAQCKTVKGTASTVDHSALEALQLKNQHRKPRTLDEWRMMFQTVYPRSPDDLARSTLGLMEELGELAEAIRVFDLYPKYFAGEVADVFSYLMGIATEYAMAREIAGQPPFEFEKEFLKRYPGYCFACGNKICICPAVPAATIGRMSKELDLADDDRIFFRDAQAAQARGHDVALRVRRYVGSSEGLLNAIPLDRGEARHD